MRTIIVIGVVIAAIAASVFCPQSIRNQIEARVTPDEVKIAEAREAFGRMMEALTRSAPADYDPQEHEPVRVAASH